MGDSVPKTAVLLDDQPLWLDALEQLLVRAGVHVVGKTTQPSDVLALIEEHQPDVLIASADSSEYDGGGITCVRQTRDRWPEIKSVVLSADDQPHQVQAAFDAGASVYCVKRAAAEDLAVAIRQAFEHSIYLASSYAAARPANPGSQPAVSEAIELTRREVEILQLVSEGHSNSALAKMLWVTEQTVKFHLSNIYRKLNVSNRTEASRWAQLHGLLPEATPTAATAA
jgi:DNA-binding NarL/FixJ family response regulator